MIRLVLPAAAIELALTRPADARQLADSHGKQSTPVPRLPVRTDLQPLIKAIDGNGTDTLDMQRSEPATVFQEQFRYIV